VTDPGALWRALDTVVPGAGICVTGDLGSTRLEINRSGTKITRAVARELSAALGRPASSASPEPAAGRAHGTITAGC
jgi:hypothetical protein